MRFHAEHHFQGSAVAVMALLVDPDFHRELQLPDLGLPEVVESSEDGDEGLLRLRYAYVGQLDPIAQRLLGHRDLTWLQELRLDRARGRGTLSFAAEADPGKLRGQATFTVTSEDGDASAVRRLDGELVAKLPMIGGMAERRIVPGLLRRLDIEAEALDARVRG